MSAPLLRVEDLRTHFRLEDRTVRAVDGVGFELSAGETLGIVGESGCGKTVACLSILRLVDPPGYIASGSRVCFREIDLLDLSEKEMRRIRGNEISMVFQEPMTSLNPVLTIGVQIGEVVKAHRRLAAGAARERAIEMLDLVGIADAKRRVNDYPHQLSGGERQRAMIAMALVCEPSVLIADEPTTALDVTVQAELLSLLRELQDRIGMAMIFVSHDLGVVSEIADRVAVMYGGQIVETAPATDIFDHPRHPYTEGLLRSLPRPTDRARRLPVIPGAVADPARWPPGCRFSPRCLYAWDRCSEQPPPLLGSRERGSRCWLEEETQRRVGSWYETPDPKVR